MTGNAADLYLALTNTAKVFLGVREIGPNMGPMVESFQKAVDGKASGEPWCAGFVAFCLKEVETQFRARCSLSLSEHCLTLWNQNKSAQTQICKPGFVAIWRHGNTGNGHTGIVVELDPADPNYFWTIEGNTSGGVGMNRDGDGVYKRHRQRMPISGLAGTPFQLLGFLDPWKSKSDS